jgi:hypothetical protein
MSAIGEAVSSGQDALRVCRSRQRRIAVLLSVHGDESADEKKQRVFAVAGVIGSEEMWESIESGWVTRTSGVPFHANHCDSDQGVYAGRPHSENKVLYRDLTIMLAESGLGGWGFAIDTAAQRRIFPDAPDIAYYRCFIEVIDAMKNCAANNRETVKFTFDSREESEHNAGMLYGMFREAPEWKSYMFPEISFVCSREHPRVQVADLFARESMKTVDNLLSGKKRPPRKSWLALYGTGRFHVDAVSIDWFEDLKRKMDALQNVLGMTRDNYIAWLKQHNLIHNTTNMFRFMAWCEKRDRT